MPSLTRPSFKLPPFKLPPFKVPSFKLPAYRPSPRMEWVGALLMSLLIIFAFVWAAWWVLPHAPRADQIVYFREPAPPLNPDVWTGPVPVFVMRPDHSVIRHGTASLEKGRIRVEMFGSTVDEYADATQALLADPSLGILWGAASENSQNELRRRITNVQDQAAQAVERVITSPVFTADYRPVLRAMLTDAVSHAWRDPRTQAALEGLLANAQPAMRRVLRGDVQEIMVSRLQTAVWEMVRANWANAFGMPFGYELDYEPAIRAMTATLSDPRVQQVLVEFGRAQLETAEARQMAERIAIGVIDALMRDRRVPAVVTQMFWDPRLRNMLRPFTDSTFALLGALPQHLGGLGAQSSLNPLAAHVFKAFAVASRVPLILLVTPEDKARLLRVEGDTAIPLQPMGAGL